MSDLAEFISIQGYGIMTFGNQRSVMVGPPDGHVNCPPRWIYIPNTTPNLAQAIRDAVKHVIKGEDEKTGEMRIARSELNPGQSEKKWTNT